MGFYKKTILLSNQSNYEKGMAILTIEKNNGGIFGSIKAFDFENYKNLILGICADGYPIIKQNIIFSNGKVFNFKLNNDFDIDSKIGCVLAEVNSQTVKPIVWGTNGARAEYKQDIIHIFEKDIERNSCNMQNFENPLKEANIQDKVEINIEAKKRGDEADLYESSDEEIEELIDEEIEKNDSFFTLIEGQVDELFKKYPEERRLINLIPESKWVKVDYDDGKDYVFGLIYEKGSAKYICYGVPGNYDSKPPEDLLSYSQWINIEGDVGYWIMYQDATTGESVVVDELDNIG